MGWMLLATVSSFVGSFALGWGAVPWVYPAEIFPMDVKEKALSISVFTQWVANCAITALIQFQLEFLKAWGTFAFFAVCLAGILVYVLCCVPEVKGLTERDIENLFVTERHLPQPPKEIIDGRADVESASERASRASQSTMAPTTGDCGGTSSVCSPSPQGA